MEMTETIEQKKARWEARDAEYIAGLDPAKRAEVLERRAKHAAEKAEKDERFAVWREKNLDMPAWVLIAWIPGENHPKGLIEHSFSMDWSGERARMWWSGKAISILGEHTLDGLKDAEKQRDYYSLRNPDWRFEIIDSLDPDSPIEIDRERWLRAMYDGGKFDSRNASFKMKE